MYEATSRRRMCSPPNAFSVLGSAFSARRSSVHCVRATLARQAGLGICLRNQPAADCASPEHTNHREHGLSQLGRAAFKSMHLGRSFPKHIEVQLVRSFEHIIDFASRSHSSDEPPPTLSLRSTPSSGQRSNSGARHHRHHKKTTDSRCSERQKELCVGSVARRAAGDGPDAHGTHAVDPTSAERASVLFTSARLEATLT